MIWTGAGLPMTGLVVFLVPTIFGINPDEHPTTFFFTIAPFLFIAGMILGNLSLRLREKWRRKEAQQGIGYTLNSITSALKCDFSDPPSVFFIPMPLLSFVSIFIGILCWAGVF